jgi:hypothetical protein
MAFSHYHNNTSFLDFRSFDMRISPFFLHSRNSQITVISVADSPAFACGFSPPFSLSGRGVELSPTFSQFERLVGFAVVSHKCAIRSGKTKNTLRPFEIHVSGEQRSPKGFRTCLA